MDELKVVQVNTPKRRLPFLDPEENFRPSQLAIRPWSMCRFYQGRPCRLQPIFQPPPRREKVFHAARPTRSLRAQPKEWKAPKRTAMPQPVTSSCDKTRYGHRF